MSYKHFSNLQCEYYPCHGLEDQNCLFCFCPLYLISDCLGDPVMVKGVKDCSQCTKNHDAKSYDFVMSRLKTVFSRLGSDLGMIKLD